jgi:hypothetical protein
LSLRGIQPQARDFFLTEIKILDRFRAKPLAYYFIVGFRSSTQRSYCLVAYFSSIINNQKMVDTLRETILPSKKNSGNF